MSVSSFDIFMKELFWGNIFMIICSAFYLLWWGVAFKPDASFCMALKGTLLAAAALTGSIGLAFTVMGISSLPQTRGGINVIFIILGGAAVYFALLAVTYFVFKRQVTVELLLIVGWAVLELCEVNVLYGAEKFSTSTAVIFTTVVTAAIIISLVCYVLYYRIGKTASYIVGMIPLLSAAIATSSMTAVMAR